MAGEIVSDVTAVDSGPPNNKRRYSPAMANYSTKDTLGGLIIYVRAKPWSDTEFAQVLLPVALSYETFVCKLCVALGVQRDMVKKVVKLPDILIRSTEDVIRITPFEKLELVLHRSLWTHEFHTKLNRMKPWCTYWFWTLLFVFSLSTAVQCSNLLKKFEETSTILSNIESKLKTLENKLNAKIHTTDVQTNVVDDVVKQMGAKIERIEANLLENLNELDEKLQELTKTHASLSSSLQQTHSPKIIPKRKLRSDS